MVMEQCTSSITGNNKIVFELNHYRNDQALLEKEFEVFDALYAILKKKIS